MIFIVHIIWSDFKGITIFVLPFVLVLQIFFKWCRNEAHCFLTVLLPHRFFSLWVWSDTSKVILRPPRNNTSVSVFNIIFYGQEKPKKKKPNLWVTKIFDVWSWIFTEPFLPTNCAICLECDHTEMPTQPRLSAHAVIRHTVFHFFFVPSIPLGKAKTFLRFFI